MDNITFKDLLIMTAILAGLILVIRLFIELDIWRLKRILKKKQKISGVTSLLYGLDTYLLKNDKDIEAKKLRCDLQALISEYQIKYEKTKDSWIN